MPIPLSTKSSVHVAMKMKQVAVVAATQMKNHQIQIRAVVKVMAAADGRKQEYQVQYTILNRVRKLGMKNINKKDQFKYLIRLVFTP